MTTTLRDRIAQLLVNATDMYLERAERCADAILALFRDDGARALAATNDCWHCKVQLEPTRPRCERCPEECDDADCREEGCATGPASET